jgi:hypothetical protein
MNYIKEYCIVYKIEKIKRKNIFDGIEDNLNKFSYKINIVDKKYSFTVNDFYNNSLEELENKISKNDFNKIIDCEKYKIINSFRKVYKSKENLDLYFKKIDNLIFIFSFGEFQPARYNIYFECIWIME